MGIPDHWFFRKTGTLQILVSESKTDVRVRLTEILRDMHGSAFYTLDRGTEGEECTWSCNHVSSQHRVLPAPVSVLKAFLWSIPS